MKRETYMRALQEQLRGFSPVEVGRVLEYYDELFSDSLEAGKTEEEICAGLESPDIVAERVRVELAFVRAEQQPSAKSMNTVMIILLSVLALPIGLPLGFAVIMVLLAAVMVVVSLVTAAFATTLALGISGLAMVVAGIYMVVINFPLAGFSLIGAGLICLGLTLAVGVLSEWLLRLTLKATAKLFRKIYNSIMNRKRKSQNKTYLRTGGATYE